MNNQRAILDSHPGYLRPYVRAVARHGGGFGSLLWSSPQTQAARFDALVRIADMQGSKLLDAGCGRADLLVFLMAREIFPSEYVGVEAVPELQDIARSTVEEYPGARIVAADFVSDPESLNVGTDVAIFCGSLNTLDPFAFEVVLRRVYATVRSGVVFNFLSSPDRAAASHLTWHRPQRVVSFARSISRTVRTLEGYLDGDCTVGIFKDGQ